MRTLTGISFIALCMASLAGSPAASAQNEPQNVADENSTRSEQSAAVDTALEQMIKDGQPLTPVEQRTVEIIREAGQSADGQQNPFDATPPGWQLSDDTGSEPVVDLAASPANENARDPCLLSWDPRCYAKHAADYDPRWGYAPSVLRRRNVNVSSNSTSVSGEPNAP
jgi:hypothetical protein